MPTETLEESPVVPPITKVHHLASLLSSLPPDLAAQARSHAEQHFATLAASHGQERALSILSAGLEGVPLPADVTKAAPLIGAAELYLRLRGADSKSLTPVTLWLASDDADAAALAAYFADKPLGRVYCGLERGAYALGSAVAKQCSGAVVPTSALSPDRVLSFLQAAIEEADDAGTLIIAPPEVLGIGKAWLEAGQPEIDSPLPRGGRVVKGAVLRVEGHGQTWQVKTQAILKCMEGENVGKPGPCPQGGNGSASAPKKRPMQVFDDSLDEAATAIGDDPQANAKIVEAVYEQADRATEAVSAQVDGLIDFVRTSNEEGRDADLVRRIQDSLKDYESEIRSGKAEIIEKLEAVRDAFDDWASVYHYRNEDEDLEAERGETLEATREALLEALKDFPTVAQGALENLHRGINAAVEEQDSEWQSAAEGHAGTLNDENYTPEDAAEDAEIYNDELKTAGNPYRLMQDEDGVWYADVPDEEETEGKKRLAERRTKAIQKRHDRWLAKHFFSVTKTLDRQGGELPAVDRISLERADFITYPEDVQGANCSSCRHNAEGMCQFNGEVAGQPVDLRGQPVNARNCCGAWDRVGVLRAWRDRAKTARPVRKSQPADSSGDADTDPVATAEAIADVLGGLLGEDALLAFETTKAEEEGKPQGKAFAGILKWDSLQHPRGPNGRFIPKGSPEAVASAKAGIDEIRKLGAGARTPEHAKKLADHLSILTVKQLHELKKEYGLKASGKLREHLVAKLLDRLPGAQERIDAERKAAAKQLGLPAEATMRDIVEHVAVEAGYPEHFISKQELEEKLDALGVSVPVQRGEAVRAAFEVLREGVRGKPEAEQKPQAAEKPEAHRAADEGRIMPPGKWAGGTNPAEIAAHYGLPEDFYEDNRRVHHGSGGFAEMSGEVAINPKYDPDGKVEAARSALEQSQRRGDRFAQRKPYEEALRGAMAEAVQRARAGEASPQENPAEPEAAPDRPSQDPAKEGQARARAGGEIGPNGEWYPGGAFIATTNMPKRQRQQLERSASGRVEIEPGKREVPPPGKIPIYTALGPGTTLNPREMALDDRGMAYYRVPPEEREQMERALDKYKQGERYLDPLEFPLLMSYSDAARMVVNGMAIPGDALQALARKVSGGNAKELEERLGVGRYTPKSPKPPEPGFTGTDSLGRRWENGKLVAKPQEEKPKGADRKLDTQITDALEDPQSSLRARSNPEAISVAALRQANPGMSRQQFDDAVLHLWRAGKIGIEGFSDWSVMPKDEVEGGIPTDTGTPLTYIYPKNKPQEEKPAENSGKSPQSPIDNTPKASDNTSGGGERPKPEETTVNTQDWRDDNDEFDMTPAEREYWQQSTRDARARYALAVAKSPAKQTVDAPRKPGWARDMTPEEIEAALKNPRVHNRTPDGVDYLTLNSPEGTAVYRRREDGKWDYLGSKYDVQKHSEKLRLPQ